MRVFADTAYFIALLNGKDTAHRLALDYARQRFREIVVTDFILLELYTDGTDEASQVNQNLQEKKFATVAIPYYAIIDGNENVVASFPGLTRKPEEFRAFLAQRTPTPAS